MLHLLRTITYSSGGPIEEVFDNVRARTGKDINYLKGIMLKITQSLTSAATSNAIAQDQFPGVLPSVNFEDQNGENLFDNFMSAMSIEEVARFLYRRGPVRPTALAADTNTTNTKTQLVYIPFWFPHLQDPRLFLQPAALLKKIKGTWAANTLYGTGQTIAAATTMEVYADYLPLPKLEGSARVTFGQYQLRKFLEDPLPLRGRVLAALVTDPLASATSRIGTTDFTDFEIAGNDLATYVRTSVDAPAHGWNISAGLSGDDDDGVATVPSAAAARSIPLYVHPVDCQASELPEEGEPSLSLIVGAGAPALTEQAIVYAVARPYSDEKLASVVGRSRDFDVDTQQAMKMLSVSPGSNGRQGTIPGDHPLAPYLRRTALVGAVAGNGCKTC